MAVVIYFSHDGENLISGEIKKIEVGNTKIVAEKISQKLACPVYEIVPIVPYPLSYDETIKRSMVEKLDDDRPEIIQIPYDFSLTDTIFLGYPNWHNAMPAPVKTFIDQYDLSEKAIYPFCTHEGSAMGNSMNELQERLLKSEIKIGLPVRGSRVDRSETAIKNWLCQYKNGKWSECKW